MRSNVNTPLQTSPYGTLAWDSRLKKDGKKSLVWLGVGLLFVLSLLLNLNSLVQWYAGDDSVLSHAFVDNNLQAYVDHEVEVDYPGWVSTMPGGAKMGAELGTEYQINRDNNGPITEICLCNPTGDSVVGMEIKYGFGPNGGVCGDLSACDNPGPASPCYEPADKRIDGVRVQYDGTYVVAMQFYTIGDPLGWTGWYGVDKGLPFVEYVDSDGPWTIRKIQGMVANSGDGIHSIDFWYGEYEQPTLQSQVEIVAKGWAGEVGDATQGTPYQVNKDNNGPIIAMCVSHDTTKITGLKVVYPFGAGLTNTDTVGNYVDATPVPFPTASIDCFKPMSQHITGVEVYESDTLGIASMRFYSRFYEGTSEEDSGWFGNPQAANPAYEHHKYYDQPGIAEWAIRKLKGYENVGQRVNSIDFYFGQFEQPK